MAMSGTAQVETEPLNRGGQGIGYFVLSLDTELAWGYFDKARARRELFSKDGSTERQAVTRLLALCDEHEVSATWAMVGHLAVPHSRCSEACPVNSWCGRLSSYEEIRSEPHPLWYGPDIADKLVASAGRHELAFHGFSHEVFDEAIMSRERARNEISLWRDAFSYSGVELRSVVFPRNIVGHLDVFAEEGFTAFRSVKPERYGQGRSRLLRKYADHLFGLTLPPVHLDLTVGPRRLVDVAASVEMFGFNRAVERRLDDMGWQTLRMRRIARAVRHAGRVGGTVHLWAHPWEFRTAQDFEKLRYVLDVVARERDAGRIHSVTMAQRAEVALGDAVGAVST